MPASPVGSITQFTIDRDGCEGSGLDPARTPLRDGAVRGRDQAGGGRLP
jgi:hypothetical protein